MIRKRKDEIQTFLLESCKVVVQAEDKEHLIRVGQRLHYYHLVLIPVIWQCANTIGF